MRQLLGPGSGRPLGTEPVSLILSLDHLFPRTRAVGHQPGRDIGPPGFIDSQSGSPPRNRYGEQACQSQRLMIMQGPLMLAR